MATAIYRKAHVKVADELFLTVALLHQEHPARETFSIREILERATKEGLGESRSDQRSLRLHAYEHAAANVAPGRGGKYRMVFRQEDNQIRLLKASDYVHPDRHQKSFPDVSEIPAEYHDLLAWAKARYGSNEIEEKKWLAGLFELRGLGKHVWEGVDPDEYVRSLREGWE